MIPSLKRVFVLKESRVELHLDELESIETILAEYLEETTPGTRSLVKQVRDGLSSTAAPADDTRTGAINGVVKVGINVPDDQRTQTLILGAFAAAAEDAVDVENREWVEQVRDSLKLKPMPAKTARDVNADPHASPSAKVAADRELEKEK